MPLPSNHPLYTRFLPLLQAVNARKEQRDFLDGVEHVPLEMPERPLIKLTEEMERLHIRSVMFTAKLAPEVIETARAEVVAEVEAARTEKIADKDGMAVEAEPMEIKK